MKIGNILVYLCLLAFYTAIVYYVVRPNKAPVTNNLKPEYWEKPGFKTDTTYLPGKPYPQLVPYRVEVPGKEVVKWDTVPRIVYVPKDTNLSPIKLSKNYGKYPFLVDADFKKDLITLTTEDTSGNVFTNKYPVNYDRFEYRYANNGMSVNPVTPRVEKTKTKFLKYDGTYINYQKDLLNNHDRISAETSVTIKDKLRVGVFGEQYLNNAPIKQQFGFKVGVSLF